MRVVEENCTASHFLSVFSTFPKDESDKVYFGAIASLDLSTSCIARTGICCEDQISAYLDVASDGRKNDFCEDDYLTFLTSSVEDFLARFRDYLSEELTDSSNHQGLFDELLQIEPCIDSVAVIQRYLTAYDVTDCRFDTEMSSDTFQAISSVLYINNYTESFLSFLLIGAVCENDWLPDGVFQDTEPPGKLDYILYHFKLYCEEDEILETFTEFRHKNLIHPCLHSGKKELLEILLKYGDWRMNCLHNLLNLVSMCFNYEIEESLVVLECLDECGYDPKRFLFILRMYYAMQVSRKEPREPYLAVQRLAWRALPDPFLCASEMHSILMKTLPDEKHCSIEDFCEDYRTEFCPGRLQPRSLKHKARYAVRRALSQNSYLPEGVDLLEIPDTCKAYLRLEF